MAGPDVGTGHELFIPILAVDIVYKTSNQLKTYLSRFWDYYNTSPALQLALESA